MWGQSWIVNYGYHLILAIPWCELIPNIVNDYWDTDTTDIWGLSGSLGYIGGLFSLTSTVRVFKLILSFPTVLLLAPFLSSNNFSLFWKLWPGVVFKINTRQALTSIFHHHFEVTCCFKFVTLRLRVAYPTVKTTTITYGIPNCKDNYDYVWNTQL